MARTTQNHMWIIRADVAGRTSALVSHGSSEIVGPDGRRLTVASLIAPYVMYVSEFAPSDQYEDENYVRVPLQSANFTFNPDALKRAS